MALPWDDRHPWPMVELILLVLAGLGCLALLAAVPLEYLEERSDERSRRIER